MLILILGYINSFKSQEEGYTGPEFSPEDYIQKLRNLGINDPKLFGEIMDN